MPTPSQPGHRFEVDVLQGLEAIAAAELAALPQNPTPARPPARSHFGVLGFTYRGDVARLLQLRTVVAVYHVAHHPVPRPRALLGDQYFRALLGQIALARRLHPPAAYATFVVSAAGADSAVMTRLKDELARHTGLTAAVEGDLLLRIRPAIYARAGWETSVRLSPRPLSARAWRVCNMEGALNAAVAYAMVLLSRPTPHDLFLNLACGSGSILIERGAWGPARLLLGCDTSTAALACAGRNAIASGYGARIQLHPWDATALPLADRSVDALCADLPFGHLVGSHAQNVALYPRLLDEAARVARRGARFVALTHEVRLMESLLTTSAAWATEQALSVFLGGLHPRLFVLRRR